MDFFPFWEFVEKSYQKPKQRKSVIWLKKNLSTKTSKDDAAPNITKVVQKFISLN